MAVTKILAFCLLAYATAKPAPKNVMSSSSADLSELYNSTKYANLTDEEIARINEAQSDLTFTPKQKSQMRNRNIAFSANLWPGGVVPFDIDPAFNSLPQAREMIEFAMAEYARYTCIKLIPRRPQDQNYLVFTTGQGCNSLFGMVGGPQPVRMSTYCNNYPQVIIHEVGHALGLIHEQQRPDRDQYVQIDYNNVAPDMAFNFDKVPLKNVRIFPYDYSSMMHYDAWAFSTNRQMAMIARQPQYTRTMGWYRTFSQSDIERINYYYQCGNGK